MKSIQSALNNISQMLIEKVAQGERKRTVNKTEAGMNENNNWYNKTSNMSKTNKNKKIIK